jgi:hypothetical protein
MLEWRGPEGGVWEGLIDGSTHQFVKSILAVCREAPVSG